MDFDFTEFIREQLSTGQERLLRHPVIVNDVAFPRGWRFINKWHVHKVQIIVPHATNIEYSPRGVAAKSQALNSNTITAHSAYLVMFTVSQSVT